MVLPTTLFVAPPLLITFVGPPAESAPEPTSIRNNEPAAPPDALIARIGTPVIFPGRSDEIPYEPVMKRYVGTGTPLTLAAVPPPGPLVLPSEPEAELFAPGNGVIKIRPLVVRITVPKFVIAGRVRSSNTQSRRSGRSFRWLFIVIHANPRRTTRCVWHRGLTSQSTRVYAIRVLGSSGELAVFLGGSLMGR